MAQAGFGTHCRAGGSGPPCRSSVPRRIYGPDIGPRCCRQAGTISTLRNGERKKLWMYNSMQRIRLKYAKNLVSNRGINLSNYHIGRFVVTRQFCRFFQDKTTNASTLTCAAGLRERGDSGEVGPEGRGVEGRATLTASEGRALTPLMSSAQGVSAQVLRVCRLLSCAASSLASHAPDRPLAGAPSYGCGLARPGPSVDLATRCRGRERRA